VSVVTDDVAIDGSHWESAGRVSCPLHWNYSWLHGVTQGQGHTHTHTHTPFAIHFIDDITTDYLILYRPTTTPTKTSTTVCQVCQSSVN